MVDARRELNRAFIDGKRGGLANRPPVAYVMPTQYLPVVCGGWPSRAAFFVFRRRVPLRRAPGDLPGLLAILSEDSDTTDLPRAAGLEARVVDAIAPSLAAMGYELVRVAVLGRERPTVQIMADRADGAPIAVADCEEISQALGPVLDVADLVPGTWTLEVSSPGIDRPLTRVKDWNRFAGHLARAEMAIPLDGRRRISGVVLGADETHARMRLDDGTELALPLDDIRRAKLVLTDALIAATARQPPSH
jgi:ribosome maturation factor RimP